MSELGVPLRKRRLKHSATDSACSHRVRFGEGGEGGVKRWAVRLIPAFAMALGQPTQLAKQLTSMKLGLAPHSPIRIHCRQSGCASLHAAGTCEGVGAALGGGGSNSCSPPPRGSSVISYAMEQAGQPAQCSRYVHLTGQEDLVLAEHHDSHGPRAAFPGGGGGL